MLFSSRSKQAVRAWVKKSLDRERRKGVLVVPRRLWQLLLAVLQLFGAVLGLKHCFDGLFRRLSGEEERSKPRRKKRTPKS